MTAAPIPNAPGTGTEAADDADGVSTESGKVTERLLEAATSVFAERGFEAARVAEIARRAGLTTGAIYARWPGKRDMLIDAVDHILPRILPRSRLSQVGATEMLPPEMIAALGTSLMAADDVGALRDVMLQAFVSARRDEEFRATVCRALNEEADQLRSIVSAGKSEGFFDPVLSTTAIVMLCQAVGLGTHLVRSAGLEDHNIPALDEWNALVARLIAAAAPTSATALADPSPAVEEESSDDDRLP